MSWKSCCPFGPYPPAAPVWGCPGDETGQSETHHTRANRWGTILLLNRWGRGSHVKHKKPTQSSRLMKIKLKKMSFYLAEKRFAACARVPHLYWCYLGNLNPKPSISPVNWCRGRWSFAAYFLLHWRKRKEPKSTHRVCPFMCVSVCERKSARAKSKSQHLLKLQPLV